MGGIYQYDKNGKQMAAVYTNSSVNVLQLEYIGDGMFVAWIKITTGTPPALTVRYYLAKFSRSGKVWKLVKLSGSYSSTYNPHALCFDGKDLVAMFLVQLLPPVTYGVVYDIVTFTIKNSVSLGRNKSFFGLCFDKKNYYYIDTTPSPDNLIQASRSKANFTQTASTPMPSDSYNDITFDSLYFWLIRGNTNLEQVNRKGKKLKNVTITSSTAITSDTKNLYIGR